MLSKDAYQKKLEELQKQMMELQSLFVDYNKELEKQQKEKTEPIFEKIMAIVKRIATTENYDIVVDKTTVAYVRTDLDLTDKSDPDVQQRSDPGDHSACQQREQVREM